MVKQGGPTSAERMGHITTQSGGLLVIDPGLLPLWSHDRPIVAAASAGMSESTAAVANTAVDLAVEGPDAERAGRRLGRQSNPLYLYDVPAAAVAKVRATFDQIVREGGLDARLSPLPDRVRHRRRVDQALALSPDGGVVQFHGIPAVVVAGVPAGVPLPVWGVRMADQQNADRWDYVYVELLPGSEGVRSDALGTVAVDEAKLLFADVDALGRWEHHRPSDGLADYVFWGRDAANVAARVNAPRVDGRSWGWVDLPVREVVGLAEPVEAIRAAGEARFATDFRPHSDYFRLLHQVRGTPTGSGAVSVGGQSMCGFHTSWGDGHFPVFVDRDAAGRPVRLAVQFGPRGP